jgi:hypothetical protein
MSDPDHGGFLRRWSSRKRDAREGKPLAPEPAQANPAPLPSNAPGPVTTATDNGPAEDPVPTLDDVQALTPDADFRAFVRHEVPADIKNAAMKKLFADPHFNVMDGLDVYIDDYSQPDPLAPATLRQMVSAKFLNLVEEPEEQAPTTPERSAELASTSESVAQCDHCPVPSETRDHDHPDLRLQPDPGAGCQDPGATPD